MEDQKPKMIATIFTYEERMQIVDEAKRKGVKTMSDVIRMAVVEYFNNHKKEIEGEIYNTMSLFYQKKIKAQLTTEKNLAFLGIDTYKKPNYQKL
ncbi:MAG: hypothetical protein MJ060_01815, partial [Clostridia bacterium]|nr:hypothetical protein [Clostridia bacterium]